MTTTRPTPATTATCRRCNGTGFRIEVAHVDGGRCWHCGPGNDIVYETDEEFDARQARLLVERKARREVRQAAATARIAELTGK